MLSKPNVNYVSHEAVACFQNCLCLNFTLIFLSKCNGKWEWEHSTRHSSRWLLLFTFSRWSWIWNVGFFVEGGKLKEPETNP